MDLMRNSNFRQTQNRRTTDQTTNRTTNRTIVRSLDDSPHVVIPIRDAYPSDLSDRQWKKVETVIPQERRLGRKRETAMREVVNTMSYRWSTGCSWRMLPHDLPPWPTVYTYFRHWLKDGTLKQIRLILLKNT